MAQNTGHGFKTRLTEKLGCRYPIISAGMGGPARSELAAAVSEAGGFGLLGMVREPPALIAREIAAVRARTDRPFGVNVIPFATDPKLLDDQLEVCFAAKVPAMCFHWNVMPGIVARAREADCLVLHQVGSVAAAIEAERAGADVIIVANTDMYGGFGLLQLIGTAGYAHVASGDTFFSFKSQLEAFISYLRTSRRPFPFEETVELMQILIAALRSREQGGREVALAEI